MFVILYSKLVNVLICLVRYWFNDWFFPFEYFTVIGVLVKFSVLSNPFPSVIVALALVLKKYTNWSVGDTSCVILSPCCTFLVKALFKSS